MQTGLNEIFHISFIPNLITTTMSDARVKFAVSEAYDDDEEWFVPPAPILAGAHVRGIDSYREMYSNSINNTDEFWKTVAKELYFEKTSNKVSYFAFFLLPDISLSNLEICIDANYFVLISSGLFYEVVEKKGCYTTCFF
ncbi:unnamed protein product [Onchocerca flexuosa]|uniref:ACAS_N domain-containing protein n=1 Tax=Onchocerca flexuosa TaxID=387005 RepID=A0A183HI34_9BILA|nr:unnamed protein product [Onchocerca flexuosa]